MLGTIKSFDISLESGTLESSDGQVHKFNIFDCYGFEEFPEVNDKVEFGVSGGELFYVEYKLDANAKETKENKGIEKKHQKTKKEKENIYDKIELSVPVDDAINNYFATLIFDLKEYEFDFTEFENLDYIKMRRFLNTAYHNLLDLDARFVDNDLESLYDTLNYLYKVYQNFLRRLNIPQTSYEEMFLSIQPEYVWRKDRLDLNRGDIITQKGIIKNISSKMKLLQQKVYAKQATESSIEKDYKHLNTMYVDSLHHMANLKEENIILNEELQAFEKIYYEEFIVKFTKFSREKKMIICRLMDGYAYFFDKKMWECAEQSTPIQEFFRKANIQEEFSSKTYLKYYLKGIDDLKMGEQHRELKTLLSYLESLSQISVVIIDENRDFRSKLIHIFRSKGTDVKVSAYERVGLFHQRLKKEHVDLLLLDKNIRNPSSLESVKMINKIENKRARKCRICLTGNSFTKEKLYEFNQLGVDYFLLKTSSEKVLDKNVDELLEDLGTDQLEKDI